MIFPPRQQSQYPMEKNLRNVRNTRNDMQPSRFNIKSFGSNSVGGVTKTLDSVQQVLSVVQSSAPYIQEYGPMIKNLPAMYRMMKAFKQIESTDDNTSEVPYKEEENKTDPVAPVKQPKKTKTIGESKPKLYI